MNARDLSEIKRRLNPEKRHPTLLTGLYLGSDGHVIASFAQSVGQVPQEENEKYMAIFRRVLSGTPGQNLLEIDFPASEDGFSDKQKLLSDLADTALRDEDVVGRFYQEVVAYIQTLEGEQAQSVENAQAAGNYLALLMHDGYDVPHRNSTGDIERDTADTVLNYVLCALCPVKQSKPALSYYAAESEFHSKASDWIVGAPELGFMYPAFEERGANVNRVMYYTRDAANVHASFLEQVFAAEPGMSAGEQRETFQAILQESLAEECSMGVVQAVHETICARLEEQKADKTAEPLAFSQREVRQVLEDCGVPEEKAAAFEEKYAQTFGERAEIPAVNMVTPKQFKVETPSVSIKVDPEHSDLVETRIIDGKCYILVLADGDVEVNGVRVTHHVADEN